MKAGALKTDMTGLSYKKGLAVVQTVFIILINRAICT